jgi:ribose transport system ATP-binding protein
MSGQHTLLAVSGLCKSYHQVVLSDVDFELRAGEVHALVGENGAGKSTLSKIICGLTNADAGNMLLQGNPYAPRGLKDAAFHGVRMVQQELNLIGTLSVAENMLLTELPNRFGIIDYRRLNAETGDVLRRMGMSAVDPSFRVESLSVGRKQMVEVAAGVLRNCAVLILDEPTAALTDSECRVLFERIRELKSAGTGIIYISHRMDEIKQISDRITVLRDGKVVAAYDSSDVSTEEIVRSMVGRDLGKMQDAAHRKYGEAALRVEGLCRGQSVKNVSFSVRQGEILGFAGLMGSGRTETMRAVFGADRPTAGRIYLGNSLTPIRIRSPRDAVKHGIALLTEDRKEQGLLLPLSIRINTTLAAVSSKASRYSLISERAETEATARLCDLLSLRYHSQNQRVRELSGGNQQKVVIAKWLYRDCDVLIFDEPTRGIDVGAKFEIYSVLSDLTSKGKAIILVSSDLKELCALCDRIAVMSAGKLAGVFERSEFDQERIMTVALSGYQ